MRLRRAKVSRQWGRRKRLDDRDDGTRALARELKRASRGVGLGGGLKGAKGQ
jgi:hypothetical protein